MQYLNILGILKSLPYILRKYQLFTCKYKVKYMNCQYWVSGDFFYTRSSCLKKWLISFTAFSGESDPCTMFLSIDSA